MYFISIDIMNMLPSIRLPRRGYAILWNGARDFIPFKSNLTKDCPTKENSLEYRIKRVYDRSMRHDEIPLLSSWESYASSLPVREFLKSPRILIKPLYEFPYWANEKDLADHLIEDPPTSTRGLVKYLAAPSKYGKTCGILPAFLYSAEQRLESKERIGLTH